MSHTGLPRACVGFHTGSEVLVVQAAGVSCESGAAFVLDAVEAGWRFKLFSPVNDFTIRFLCS